MSRWAKIMAAMRDNADEGPPPVAPSPSDSGATPPTLDEAVRFEKIAGPGQPYCNIQLGLADFLRSRSSSVAPPSPRFTQSNAIDESDAQRIAKLIEDDYDCVYVARPWNSDDWCVIAFDDHRTVRAAPPSPDSEDANHWKRRYEALAHGIYEHVPERMHRVLFAHTGISETRAKRSGHSPSSVPQPDTQ